LKNQFIDGEIDILIVCSKLLTGFDAPRTQVLYIDKELKEHGLLQAIARTNRLYDGKDFGYIVDYRGLINNLDAAMEVYSGAGLENYDTADIKGVVVDVMSCVAKLRETYSQLWDVFATINNKKDPEEFEIFLADTDARGKFYDTLCSYGRAFTMVMNSTKAFAAFERKEIEMFRETFVFFSKIRKSVKIRYADALDNSEYEPQMRNLLDTYMSVKDVQVVYSPIDIMNVGEFEKVLEKLPSDRSKADAIVSHLTKRIKLNRDEDPAFYDSFSKMINDVLEAFKNKILSEKEYFKKMFGVMNDFRKGDTKQKFPDKIAGDLHAQAFYGVIIPILSSQYKLENEIIADIALSITDIIRKHDKVDWKNNIDVHNRIRQDIDDLFYEMENNQGIVVDLDDVDKISESVLNVAMRRF
jgi:type I restriction enzyme R subunit